MYEHVFHSFGLRENPFGISPDSRFYVSTPAHDAALAKLAQGVHATQNFTILTGEAGTGKTILLNHFLNWLGQQRRSSAYVFHPRLKLVELLDAILRDFGVPHQTLDRGQLLETLSRWLIGRHSMGDTPIVVIDEAQAISIRTLDQLRFLLNLAVSGKKLLQIVLVGQPELLDKMNRLELRNLRKRVTCQCSLAAFSMEETFEYVKARLASTGAVNPDIFSRDSLEAMHGYARGIPRTVNLLCEQTLIAGYAAGARVISREILRQVAEEFDLAPQWADFEERETSSKFTRLLTLVPENPPVVAAPVDSMAVPESVPVIPAVLQSPEIEPILLREEPAIEVATSTIPTRVPAAATLVTPSSIPTAERHPFEKPGFVAQKAIPSRSLGTRLGEPWLRRWEGLRAALVRDWAKFRNRYALARSSNELRVAAIKSNWAGLLRNLAKSTQKLSEQWVRQRKDLGAGLARGAAELRHWYSLAKQSKDPLLAAIKSNWVGLLRNLAKSTERLSEQWVGQRKDLGAGLARGAARLRHWYSLAKQSKDPVLAAIKDNWAGLGRKIAQPTGRLKQVSPPMNFGRGGTIERCVSYSREVGDSFVRDWKQWIHKNASPQHGVLVSSAPNVPHLRPTMIKPTENTIHRVQANSPAVKYRTRRNSQFASQWIARRERFLGKSKPFLEAPSAVPQAHQVQLSPTKFEEAGRTTLPGERFVRYWKEVRTSFLRDWNRLMSANGSAGIAARKRR